MFIIIKVMLYNIIRYKGVKTIRMVRVLMALLAINCTVFTASAQDKIVNPDISYAGTPRTCEIGGIAVEGVEGYEDYVLMGLSGLTVGQEIELPGSQITDAVKRYWPSRVSFDTSPYEPAILLLRSSVFDNCTLGFSARSNRSARIFVRMSPKMTTA